MSHTQMVRLGRVLGLIAALLAWSAAARRYERDGRVPWEVVAAGVLFAALPFAMASRGRPPRE